MEETSANIFNVIETLQEKFIILTGGCAKDKSPIFTFVDTNNENEIKFENYCKIIDYLCNIPSEFDKKNGFTILIDRRNDKWGSVKNILLYIQEYFPVKINNIYILRPQSYLQRVLSTLFFQEDSLINNFFSSRKINLKICKTLEDLYELVDKKQLTTEFGGCIHYRHQEWIEQRQFIEKLSSTVNEAVSIIKKFIKSMEETDFPNDVHATEILMNNQLSERGELLGTVLSTRRFGETILNIIEKTNKIDSFADKMDKYSALTPDIRIHYQTVYNLIRYLDDSENTLDAFWKNHYIRLNKCLALRKFEQSFKEIRISLLSIFDQLNKINDELCASLKDYEECIEKLGKLKEESQDILTEAASIYEQGTKLLIENQLDPNLAKVSQYQRQQHHQQLFKQQLQQPQTASNINAAECTIEIKLDSNDTDSQFDNNTYSTASLNDTLATVTSGTPAKNAYCIDSIEPKCDEIKRCLNEFETTYESKLNGFNKNKILFSQLQVVKDYYLKGMELFNEQQLINPNIEKTKKYLNDISLWQNQFNEIEIADEYKVMFKNISTATTPTVITIINDNKFQPLALQPIANNTNNTQKFDSGLLNVSMQEICNQLKSLMIMFNKRQEQLKKVAYSSANKPVQRVEPQQISETSNENNNKQNTNSTTNNTKSSTLPNNNFVKRNGFGGHSISFERTNSLPNGSTNAKKLSESLTDEIIDEEKMRSFEKKQKMVLNELIETEKVYINELKLIIEGYLIKLNDPTNFSLVSTHLIANRDILFGNIQDIYQFHSQYFLRDLERIHYSVEDICKLFINYKENFYLYSIYCQNKPLSEEIWQEYGINCQFFKIIQTNLGHRLPLDAYLLKPVQRISKYQLLIKELLKYNIYNRNEKAAIEQALKTMIDIVNNLNDVMHSSFIFGYADLKLQGKLLKRDQMLMTKYKRNGNKNVVNRFKINNDSNKLIELFLYEKSLIICKRKTDDVLPSLLNTSTLVSTTSVTTSGNSSTVSTPTTPTASLTNTSSLTTSNYMHQNYQFYYQFKEAIKTDEIGLTENIKSDKRKFEIWTDNYTYTFEANNEQDKHEWIIKIKNLLENQLNEIKLKQQLMKETLSNKLIDNISTTSTSSNNHSSNTSINSINSSISLDNGKYTTLNKIVRNRTSSNNQINQKAESDEDSVDNTHKYRLSNSSSSSNSTNNLQIESDNGNVIAF